MVRIGDFARMARVSVKALRYYDAIGLLQPAHTDGATGYRYYSASQLPRLNRLLVYKSLGFSLDQTRTLLADGAPAAKMRELLESRRKDLARRLETEQEQLAEVESRIRQIEREGKLPRYEVLLKRVEARPIVSLRRTLPSYAALDPLLAEIGCRLLPSEIETYGAIWHQCLFRGQAIECEAFAVLKARRPAPRGCHAGELPAGRIASVVYSDGDEDPFPQVYRAVLESLDPASYQLGSPMREIYHSAGSAPGVTEIQFPIHQPDRRNN